MAITSHISRSIEQSFINDDMEEFYMDLPSPTSSELITPLKCYQRIYDPSFLLSEIWIPEGVLLNRKSGAVMNKKKIHALHTLEKPDVATFSTYDEREESETDRNKEMEDDEIFYSDTDDGLSDYEQSRNTDSGSFSNIPPEFVEEYVCSNGHLSTTIAQNDSSFQKDFNYDKDSGSCIENYDSFNNLTNSDEINSCKILHENVSHSSNGNLNVEVTSQSHEEIKQSINSLEKELVDSPSLLDFNDNDTISERKLNTVEESNTLEKRDYYVLVKPKLNTEKVVKHHKRKTKKTASARYNHLNLNYDEGFANYLNQCNIDAAERFRQHSLDIDLQQNTSLQNHNPHEFPDLPMATSMFHHNNVNKKCEVEHKLEYSIKDISSVLTESKEAKPMTEKRFTNNEISPFMASPKSRDTLIIENIPLSVNSEELETWLDHYGKVHRFVLIPNGHICRAELEIDSDLPWIMETLNETQPFGACSEPLKCYIKESR